MGLCTGVRRQYHATNIAAPPLPPLQDVAPLPTVPDKKRPAPEPEEAAKKPKVTGL